MLCQVDARHWQINFELRGNPHELLIPVPLAAVRADDLWRHTCFELFLKSADGQYCEFNFSPSGSWAAYAFEGWRQGRRDAQLVDVPEIHCHRQADRFVLSAKWSLPLDLVTRPAQLAPCAVVEERSGYSYWALAHGPGGPDFHREDGFVKWPEY